MGARSILVTGEPDAREKLAQEGLHEYIAKPFKTRSLLEAVNKAVG